jgi:hypothetical protein
MKISLLSRLAFLLIMLSFACSDDEDPKGKYDDGVIIVNEGGFGASNGSLTFYDQNTATAQQNIFQSPGLNFAGDVVQSFRIFGDKGYLVVNDDNRIEVLDRFSYQSVATISHSDIVKPRDIAVVKDKAYISVWGPYDGNFSLIDSYVLVYDLKQNSVVKKIDTDEGVENLVVNQQRIFASNFNYGASSTVAVIDPSSDNLIDQIEVGPGPGGMVIDSNNKLWVIVTGTYQGNDGKLVRINSQSLAIEQEIDLNLNPDVDLSITPDKKNIIYASGKEVYKIGIDATAAPSVALFTANEAVTPYAFEVDPDNGDIYLGDALNFATQGVVYIYSENGALKTSFAAGINPTQFVFN